MKFEEITKRIDKIHASTGDPEIAHGLEDDLLWDFVRYVALSHKLSPMLSKKAEMIMAVNVLDFPRWYA